ncbi:hypothetical protein CYMTET_43323 [Cymbomonas tetramitiformis]|uniref:ATP-dependent DNA helicase n=1 Tax=Cymbomonas tetramitiformis TaxID=36881 RepID=A0AAE0C2F3_9CHLO|nr:hypothetical protein CYMTET_43323 [Cymbomonas tetramitiformis]
MYFGGEAGSGKSEVIKAVTTLASSWWLLDVLHKTAITGSAACLIGGCTIHKLAQLLSNMANVAVEDELKIVLPLIDEVSMLKRKENGKISLHLRKKLDNHEEPMGGLSGIGYIGDLFQLPPVLPPIPVYHRVSERSAGTSIDDVGEYIWHELLNTVILLEENHRQSDPELLRLCRAMRWGTLTAENLNILNARVINPNTGVIPPVDCVTVFSTNEQVHAMNSVMVTTWEACRG